MHYSQKYVLSRFLVIVALVCAGSVDAALAATAPSMGSAASFAVLGSTTVTCTGASTITGNLGVGPAGSAVTGFPAPCTIVGGVIQAGTANQVALAAHNDAQSAYNDLEAEACTTTYLVPTDLGGMTLASGVYCFSSSAGLTGTLNLTGTGPWIFKTVSTLITASSSSVLVNGSSTGCAPGVFWAVGSSATLGTYSNFQGVIIAYASDTLNTGANESGGVFALTGQVSLDDNHVSTCNSGGTPGYGSQCTRLQSSVIGSNFNGTSIPAGDFVWFSANASISGIPTTGGPQTVSFTNQVINVPGVGFFDLPASQVTFSSAYSCASVAFSSGTWEVTVPFSGSDEIFIGGFALPVPAGGIPGGIKGVTWSGNIASSAAGASVKWKWGAAVLTPYTAFTTYNALEVKPTHQNACAFNNGDHAGTPEGFAGSAIGGATGGGAGNVTGSWSGTATACRP